MSPSFFIVCQKFHLHKSGVFTLECSLKKIFEETLRSGPPALVHHHEPDLRTRRLRNPVHPDPKTSDPIDRWFDNLTQVRLQPKSGHKFLIQLNFKGFDFVGNSSCIFEHEKREEGKLCQFMQMEKHFRSLTRFCKAHIKFRLTFRKVKCQLRPLARHCC